MFVSVAVLLPLTGCGGLIGLGSYSKGEATDGLGGESSGGASTGGNGGGRPGGTGANGSTGGSGDGGGVSTGGANTGGSGTGGTGTGGAECSTASECDDDVACTVDTCEFGTCLNVPDNSQCSGSSCAYCSPTLGCVDGGTSGTISLIENGNFDDGASAAWSESSDHFSGLILDPAPDYDARSSPNVAWLGGTNDETSILEQQIGTQAGTATLSYWYYIDSGSAGGSDAGDTGWVFLWDNEASESVESFWLFDGSDENNTWTKKTHVFDLTQYVGQDVRLNFLVTTDSDTQYTNVLFDDVTLTVDAVSCD